LQEAWFAAKSGSVSISTNKPVTAAKFDYISLPAATATSPANSDPYLSSADPAAYAVDLLYTGWAMSSIWIPRRLHMFGRLWQCICWNGSMNTAEASAPEPMSHSRKWLIVGAILLFGIISMALLITTFSFKAETAAPETISACIKRYAELGKIDYGNITSVYGLNNFCYNSAGSQLLVDEEIIRRDNFVFQRHENVALLVMVVAITLSGVVLAGLQLLASFKLATMGKAELAGGGELSYSKDSVSFKSSVVGLVILAISFGFFLVFVIDVYELKDSPNISHPGLQNLTSQTGQFAPTVTKPTDQDPSLKTQTVPTEPAK
jgi:uncharacterized protein YneF (UPF0154 family)